MSKLYFYKVSYGSLYYIHDNEGWKFRQDGVWVLSGNPEDFFTDNQFLTLIGNNFKLKVAA